jgi:hypothetical protein
VREGAGFAAWQTDLPSLTPRGTSRSSDVASDAIIHVMQRIEVTIDGGGWTDVQELELPRLPSEGELIETKYGTCRVTSSEAAAPTDGFDGRIVCSIS